MRVYILRKETNPHRGWRRTEVCDLVLLTGGVPPRQLIILTDLVMMA